MKVGNIAPRAGIEPTSFAYVATVLTITPPRIPDVIKFPYTPVYAAPCLGSQCRLLHSSR